MPEFEQIKAGLIPAEMEDKWFIFFEAPWLYSHRSWTGHCIFGVRFEVTAHDATVVESWASRKPGEYTSAGVEHDEQLLTFLIEGLLLQRSV